MLRVVLMAYGGDGVAAMACRCEGVFVAQTPSTRLAACGAPGAAMACPWGVVCSWLIRHRRDAPRWRERQKKDAAAITGEQSEKSRTPNLKLGRSADVRWAWAVGLILRDLRKSLSQACVAVAVRAINGTPGRKERSCPSLR